MKYRFSYFGDSKVRVDMYLSALFSDFSRSYIQKMIDKWQLKVNGEVLTKNKKIVPKDSLELEIITEKLEILPQDMPLDIVYEDKNIVIVNKDAGVNTHPVPGEGGNENTLVNAVLYHVKDLAWIGWVERPWIVHRLDKDTSGLIMIAKNDEMMWYLQWIIKDRKVDKYYVTIVDGILKDKKITIKWDIWRDPHTRIKMTTKNWLNPKHAITHAEVLGYVDNKYTALKVKIETWRTHQIRVHLSSIGFPIIWDKVYWRPKVNKTVDEKYGLKRQALHSYTLSFDLYNEKFTVIWDCKPDINAIFKFN